MVPHNLPLWPSNFESAFPVGGWGLWVRNVGLNRYSQRRLLSIAPPLGKNACNPSALGTVLHKRPSCPDAAPVGGPQPTYCWVSSSPLGAGSGLPAPTSGSMCVIRLGMRQDGGRGKREKQPRAPLCAPSALQGACMCAPPCGHRISSQAAGGLWEGG